MKKTFVFIVAALLSFACLGYFFIFTNAGSTFVLKNALSLYLRPAHIEIEQAEGNFLKSKILHNVRIKDLSALPAGNVIRIQKVELSFSSLAPFLLNLKADNGRLQLPGLELILFRGQIKKNLLDINVYSRYVDIGEFTGLFFKSYGLENISGALTSFDIFITGSLSSPGINGGLKIEKLMRSGFFLTDCPVVFYLQPKTLGSKELELFGEVYLNSGMLYGAKTAVIKLGESKISFNGSVKNASLDLKGSSTVEKTLIDIILKGSFEKPDLKLSSEPSLSQERLFLMLATGKSWVSSQEELSKGNLTVDAAKDFIDYFVFGGSGSKITKQLGISDISVTFEKQKKGFGLKKSVTDKIDAIYGIEQTQQSTEKTPVTSQTFGGEYHITDSLRVGAEREFTQEQESKPVDQPVPPEDRVFLKFKKEF